MHISKIFAVLLLLTGGAPLPGPLSAGAQTQSPPPEEKNAPPLIRMDLLGLAPAQTAPPKRNIFSPRTAPSSWTEPVAPAAPGAVGLPAGDQGAVDAVAGAPSEAPPAGAPVFSVDLRFIGFVESQRTRRIIGLVIFQGQARAVVEGEVISEGIRIGKIGREEIKVILPDSSERTFSLEGEE